VVLAIIKSLLRKITNKKNRLLFLAAVFAEIARDRCQLGAMALAFPRSTRMTSRALSSFATSWLTFAAVTPSAFASSDCCVSPWRSTVAKMKDCAGLTPEPASGGVDGALDLVREGHPGRDDENKTEESAES